MKINPPIRILMAKPGLDGHDRGIKVLAAAYRDAGMDVIYLGLRQTPESVVKVAIQEGVDVIALSILSGAHMTIFSKVMELIKENNLNNVLVTGGGIIPEEDAEVVVRCRNAGAIIIGKENLEEFAAGATSNNPHYGAVHNPWGLDHVPGGSSGGGGANVAAGITFASLGTDLGGSVRLPGTFCGVVGLKQTYGRVSQRGLMVTSFNGDHIGPMTRSVADSALMLQVLAGNDPLDPSTVPVAVPDYSSFIGKGIKGLKMGVPSNHFFDMLDSDVETAVRASIASLEELGADLQDVNLPTMEYIGAMRISAMADGVVTHEEFLKNHRGDYGPDVFYRTIPGQFVLGRDYSKSLKVQRLIQEEYLRVMQQVDFLVTPTAPVPAPRIDATYIDINGENHRVRGAGSGFISRNTSPLNAVGLPAISVPCGTNRAGLPIGVQFISGPFNEGLLFQVADSYEKVSPSQGLCPLVSVGQ